MSAHSRGVRVVFRLRFQSGSFILAMETSRNWSPSGTNFAPQWVQARKSVSGIPNRRCPVTLSSVPLWHTGQSSVHTGGASGPGAAVPCGMQWRFQSEEKCQVHAGSNRIPRNVRCDRQSDTTAGSAIPASLSVLETISEISGSKKSRLARSRSRPSACTRPSAPVLCLMASVRVASAFKHSIAAAIRSQYTSMPSRTKGRGATRRLTVSHAELRRPGGMGR